MKVILAHSAYLLLMTAAGIASAASPTVVSTIPANGATGVAPDLQEMVIEFDTAMKSGYSLTGLPGSWSFEWSPDARTLRMTRQPGQAPLAIGSLVTIVLNSPPYISFFDLAGNPLGTYSFCFTIGEGTVSGAPTIGWTDPANGTTEVSRDLEHLRLSFSEAMADAMSVSGDSSWPISAGTSRSWSGDGRTLTISRDNAGTPLPPSTVVTIRLNGGGDGFQDLQGAPLGPYIFSFTTAAPGADENPVVVSTDPANGELSIGRFTSEIRITFSKPMQSSSAVQCTTGNWQPGATRWSADRLTFFMWLADPDRLLPAGERVELLLNPPGDEGFRDTDGNALDTTTISFGVETASRLIKVLPEDSEHDFDWPYYLWIPLGLQKPTVLLVEPNNTGTTSDLEMQHDASALSIVGWRARFAAELGVPLLVPTFPRPRSHWKIYTHALDRDSLTNTVEGLERIDRQLIEMIDDARDRLAAFGCQVGEKVFMMGFSASGQFTNRFAILHPERIQAAAAGSPGGWPLAPVASWQNETLDYHVGIADIATLRGSAPDMVAIRSVPLFLYMGDADTNDSVPFSDGYEDDQRELVNRLFGTTPVARWPHAEEIYRSVGMNATFALYPGVGHTITSEMFDDIAEFFAAHMPQRVARLRRPSGRMAPGMRESNAIMIALGAAGATARFEPGIHRDPPPPAPAPSHDPRCHQGFEPGWRAP